MLSIKQLIAKIYSFISTKEDNTTNDLDKSFAEDTVVITLGLTPKNEVDIAIEIKEILIKNDQDLKLHSQKIASFLYTITAGGINNTLIEIMMDQMSDDVNQKLFESILYHWLLLEQSKQNKSYDGSTHHNVPIIEPSNVFKQYSVK